MSTRPARGLYLVLISVHGLIRGRSLELGRDADTGGQILYVVELARALGRHPRVDRVDLITRRLDDPEVGPDYARPVEALGERASILRVPSGPPDYLPKEELWDHLDSFADNTLALLRERGGTPDLIHSHYADSGYVGSRLAGMLGVPLVFTGHSLGRVKRRRLLAAGLSAGQIEERYNMARRIEAEERSLASAERVITSTRQEIEEQYELYDHYQPDQMEVIPPGTDLERFRPPDGREGEAPIARELTRFLRDPHKPIVLSLSRPDPRKNIDALLDAYGGCRTLQEAANLVVLAGNRDDISDLSEGPREVLTDLLLAIDRHDLYGRVAIPKHHSRDEIPALYRLAAASHGVFVNPALTEPFGLTLIEAAASGLPIVATEDGGPVDIVANCSNGLLVDPLDPEAIARALLDVLSDDAAWRRRARKGLEGVRQHYTWEAHAKRYLEMVGPIINRTQVLARTPKARRPMLYHDRAIFTDLDQSLLGDPASLSELVRVIRRNRKCATFGIATGRRLDSALKIMKRYAIPAPDVLITSTGTAIHYAPHLTADLFWARHIDHHWYPQGVRQLLDPLPGLEPQPKSEQSRFKISYYIDPDVAPDPEEIVSLLHQDEQSVHVIQAFGQFLDILPIRASKGLALRYVSDRWDIPLERVLVAGGSGADEDMMRGNTLAVVVANRHHEELSQLVDLERVYFAERPHASGILEALDHYDFFASCSAPPPAPEAGAR